VVADAAATVTVAPGVKDAVKDAAKAAASVAVVHRAATATKAAMTKAQRPSLPRRSLLVGRTRTKTPRLTRLQTESPASDRGAFSFPPAWAANEVLMLGVHQGLTGAPARSSIQ